MTIVRDGATGLDRRHVVAAGLASVAGGVLPLAGATFEPWILVIGLVGSGVIVGLVTRRSGWIGVVGATAGTAVAGWVRPGTLAGPGSAAPAILIAAAVIAVLFFGPGWFFGTALRASFAPPDVRSGDAPHYARRGAAILAIPVGLALVWLVILARGGGCCP
jgi:hypothetical protein